MDMVQRDIFGRAVADEMDEEYDTTFFYPREIFENSDNLNRELQYVIAHNNGLFDFVPEALSGIVTSHALPIQVAGDGNCFLRAISFGLWGTEAYYQCLRHLLINELHTNLEWYIEETKETKTGKEEWEKALEQAKTTDHYLGSPHMFALANAIGRVIVLYASDERVERFGQTEDGAAGIFLPSKVEKSKWLQLPVLPIIWSSNEVNHFVPLIGKENFCVEWPIISLSYKQDHVLSESELNKIFKKNTTKNSPKRVNLLRSGKISANHMKFNDENNNNNNENYKIIKAGDKIFLVKENGFDDEDDDDLHHHCHHHHQPKEEEMVKLFYNGEYYSMPFDLPRLKIFFENRGIMFDNYIVRLLKFKNDPYEQYKEIKEQIVSNLGEIEIIPPESNLFLNVPIRKTLPLFTSSNLDKIINKLNSILSLSSDEIRALENCSKLMLEFDEFCKNGKK